MSSGLIDRETRRTGGRAEPVSRVSPIGDSREELCRRFREKYPILLDGALPPNHDAGLFFRQARELLTRSRAEPDLPPPDILRETLDAVVSVPKPSGKAGSVVVGPKSARVWWDSLLLEANAGDILSGLTKPRPVLRFYDVTDCAPETAHWNSTFDIDVALGERGRTVDFWSANRVYTVELGLIHADGRFLRLARAGRFELPRDCRGTRAVAERVLSALQPRADRPDPLIVPDEAAWEWAEGRADHADRDIEAELLIRMVYRAFLREGPRALRRALPPVRREGGVLAREFARRSRLRRQTDAAAHPSRSEAPVLLALRLDAGARAPVAGLTYPPVPVAELRTWNRNFLPPQAEAAQAASPAKAAALAAGAEPTVAAVRREDAARPPLRRPPLVQPLADAAGKALTEAAAPVFAAAESLRRRLSDLKPVPAAAPERAVVKEPAPESVQRPECGGSEAERFARGGIVFSRMVLTIEGRVRPGARLKVAGHPVQADADGNFRFECPLPGRKSRLPLRAHALSGEEMRGAVAFEWEKYRVRGGGVKA